MSDDYEPVELNGFYRAGHSTIWELADASGVLAQLNMKLNSLEFTESSSKAEAALLEGRVDFVSGNHISPYKLVAQNKPIVCIASPGNQVRDVVVTRNPIESIQDLKGKRIADTALEDPIGGYHHIRGNHTLEVIYGGLDYTEDVDWLVIADYMGEEFRKAQYEAMKGGIADATFVAGGTEDFEAEGFHVLRLDPMPMVTGPTITTSVETLQKKDRLGERMLKAYVMTVHFARMNPELAQKMLGTGSGQSMEGVRGGNRGAGVARQTLRPYPSSESVANAYKLCVMQYPEAAKLSPLALWDTHYLRDLDLSGFIGDLETQEPPQPAAREGR
jgi:ABC-type nitrate/sulfonate/bicarbonate transport system substrate-binding protein